MKKLALLGAGDLGDQIMEYVKETGMYEIVGFFDDNEALGNMHRGLPIFGKINTVENYYKQGYFDYVFITIGYRWFDTRERIYKELKGKVPFANIISPLAVVKKGAKLGEGIMISDQVYVSHTANIEDDVCITLRSVVNHGCVVKKHTFFSTNVVLAGNVTIGEKCFVGVGSVLSDGITVCDNVWLSPGSIVIKNITEPGKYVSSVVKLYNVG